MGLFKYTKNYAVAQFEGHLIKVENFWKVLPPKSHATLSVDDVEVARDTGFTMPTPHAPQMTATDVSESIKSIEVFFAGVFSIKISIVVNGEVIQKDDLSTLDELHVRYSKTS